MMVTSDFRYCMRLPVAVLVFALSSIVSQAEEMSKSMREYLQGCELMASALDSKSLADLADAQLLLSVPVLERMDEVEPVDSISKNNLGNAWIAFTPGFAEELIRSGNLSDFSELAHPYLGRKGEVDIYLWHASIAGCSSATMRTTSEGFSEILLFSTKDSDLSLDVNVSSLPVEIHREEGGDSPFTYLSWVMPSGEYEFTVTNHTDRPQSFVIAVNAE